MAMVKISVVARGWGEEEMNSGKQDFFFFFFREGIL